MCLFQGVAVIFVDPNSTIQGPSGLKVGDVITSVNGCGVKDNQQWHHCLALADRVRLFWDANNCSLSKFFYGLLLLSIGGKAAITSYHQFFMITCSSFNFI